MNALIACCLLVLAIFQSVEANVDEEIKELGDRIHGTDVEMSPEETLSSLKRLAELYSTRNDKEAHFRGKRTSGLIEACNVSENKCTFNESVKMYKIIRNNSRFVKNIVPYLQHCRAKQFQVCRPKVESAMAKISSGIKGQDKEVGRQLVENFPPSDKRENYDELFRIAPINGLKVSVLALLNSKKTWETGSAYGKKNFEVEFRRFISEPCERIRNTIGNSLDYFDPMLEVRELTSQIDNETLDWMAVNNVCWTIHRNTRLLLQHTFKALKLRDIPKKNPHF